MRYGMDQSRTSYAWESGLYGSLFSSGIGIGLVTEVTPEDSVGFTEINYHGQATRNAGRFVNVADDFKVNVTYHPQDFRMFVFALGSNVDAGVTAKFTHLVSELNTGSGNAWTSGTDLPFPSFQIETSLNSGPAGGNMVRKYAGCVMDTYTINGDEGGLLTAEIGAIAQSCQFVSGVSTTVNGSMFPYGSGTLAPFATANSAWSLSGVSIPEIRNWSLTVNNNFNAPHYANGSKVIGTPVALNRDYEISLTADADHSRIALFYENWFRSGNTFNAKLVISDPVYTATGSRTYNFVFSGCTMSAVEYPVKSDGVGETTLTIIPQSCSADFYDTGSKYGAW